LSHFSSAQRIRESQATPHTVTERPGGYCAHPRPGDSDRPREHGGLHPRGAQGRGPRSREAREGGL